MSDLSPLPLVLTACDRLHRSAMPDAPVVPARPRRRRRRGFTQRMRVVQLEKE
jgi:hypothetical protein